MTVPRLLKYFSAGALLLAAGCDGELRPAAEYVTPSGSFDPELNSGADGRAYLSWLQQQDDGHRLRYTALDERGWSGPHTAASGSDWLAGPSDWPGITAIGKDTFVAHWLRRRGTSGYASEIQIAFSADGGATWNAAVPLHDDGTDTEHGFVSLLPLDERLHVMWLDGRETGGSHGYGHAGATMLRHAVFDRSGNRLSEEIIDERSCDCCHTSAAPIDGGFIVAWRDRSEAEIRDIATRRFIGGRWQKPVTVHDDGWMIEGCPVNGPSIAARGAAVAVAWFSGSNNEPKVLAAVSRDGGTSFEAPLRIDGGRALGRVDIALLPDGDAAVCWAELEGETTVFRLARLPFATGGAPVRGRRLPAESPSGFPRLIARGDDIVIAWTEGASGATRVRAMRIRAGDI